MAKGHILIIDDNETGIKVLSQMLISLDMTSTGLQNPDQLANIADRLSEFDAVFLDLEMPVINGYEILQQLRIQFHVTAPIIAYSVHVGEIHQAVESGFNGFVGKPLRVKTFPYYMERILKGEAVWEVD